MGFDKAFLIAAQNVEEAIFVELGFVVGVPLLFYGLLRPYRDILASPKPEHARAREEDIHIRSLRFLWGESH